MELPEHDGVLVELGIPVLKAEGPGHHDLHLVKLHQPELVLGVQGVVQGEVHAPDPAEPADVVPLWSILKGDLL